MKKYITVFFVAMLCFIPCSIIFSSTKKCQVPDETTKNIGYGELTPIDAQYMERFFGRLQSQPVIAAHFIVDKKWLVLDDSEMIAIKKILAGAVPFVVPEGIDHVSLKSRTESIVLWGTHEGKLVAVDVIHTSPCVSIFDSVTQNRIYNVKGLEEEKKVLRQMIVKAKASIDEPAVAGATQSSLQRKNVKYSETKSAQER